MNGKFIKILIIFGLIAALIFAILLVYGCAFKLAIPGAELDAHLLSGLVHSDPNQFTVNPHSGD
jgi:hypothetical protein